MSGAAVELAIRAFVMPPSQSTDEQLIERLARGNSGALTPLYDRHARTIFMFLCRLMSDEAVAEDLLQETFLAAWHSARTFRGHSSVRTWLFGIAHHKAGHWLRRRRSEPLDEDAEIPAPGPAVPDLADAAWERERVMVALAQLPPAQRAVLELTFFHGLSCAEVAEALDCPVGTVKSRAHLARQRLAQLLADPDGDE
jgi:RNA polymerase sigma factor (sigma-70 family)